ncbi:exosortase A [Neptunomonas marina]|uniref:Exosortase A n=1 Tax=Neptunomonas marina TaxID=1815562 RepID=A0A437Q8D1_9GAMM|nr:exosortase A [Neptunomonas marina]RVU30757.1 exosortase A [Neptunomonas marina]
MTVSSTPTKSYSFANPWQQHAVWLSCFLVVLAVTFFDTIASMVSVWSRSDTFTHAFLILPISLWLVWGKREALADIAPRHSLLGVVLAGIGTLIWLAGSLVDTLLLQQLGVVIVLIGGIWALIGNEAAKLLLFPLGFLLFMVPMGEELVPGMMEFTADFTVAMVRLSGIPVFREGLYFSLPTGNWSVVEACSGVRYLIASTTLGFLYAHLTYRKPYKKVLFILASILVPIIANGFRAYIIVMLGHLSDMTVATGVDHLVYGWVFFGLVIFVLVTVGNRFSDDVSEDSEGSESVRNTYSPATHRLGGVFAILMMVTLSGPALAYFSDNRATGKQLAELPVLVDTGVIQIAYPWAWQPNMVGGGITKQGYRYEGKTIGVVVQHFASQRQGEELISWNNTLLSTENDAWRTLSQSKASIGLNGTPTDVTRTEISGATETLIVLSWYRVGDTYTTSRLKAKLLEMIAKVTFQRLDAAWIVTSISVEDRNFASDEVRLLEEFSTKAVTTIEQELDRAASIR